MVKPNLRIQILNELVATNITFSCPVHSNKMYHVPKLSEFTTSSFDIMALARSMMFEEWYEEYTEERHRTDC